MQIFAHLPSSFDGVQYSVYLQNNSCKSEYSFEFKNKKSRTYMRKTGMGNLMELFFILYQMLTLKGKAVRVTISLFAKAVLGSSLLYMYYV